jgi:hypothetical protein
MLGYEPYTILVREGKSLNSSERNVCPPASTDVPTDSSNQPVEERSDELQSKPRLVEHHGQLHDLGPSDWLLETAPTEDPILLFCELPAKDGTFKPVRSKKPKERYL